MKTSQTRAIGAALLAGAALLTPATSRAQTPTSEHRACRELLESGRIPWDSKGDSKWAPSNIERLCKGGLGEEPARCFEKLIRGQVNWGGGTAWQWENALKLCHGTRDASATIACFQGQMKAHIPWEQAIPNCAAPDVPEAQVKPPVLTVDQMTQCRNAIEGRIPWNNKGDTHWAPANIEKLCKGGVAEEPARCFEKLIRGQVNWGGGTSWEWQNAVNLCQGTQEASATIACFEGQIRAKVAWEVAIPNCNPVAKGEQKVQPPPTNPEAACRDAVEGHIPWNAKGETHWAPANIEKLCRGGVRDEPARCFERLMRGHVSWGGGTNWEWENALDLCRASQNHRQTIACFEDKIRAKIPWKAAIQSCHR